jgi:7,8-dihydroneopterin aldolase/epimerase/oxygenase
VTDRDRLDGEDDPLDDDELAGEAPVHVQITGLSLYTHHGVDDAERAVGQRLLIDVAFDIEECDATVTDRLEDTVDYADVTQEVALAAQGRSYRTLERLCAALADRMLDRYPADAVYVRVTKPEPPLPLPVEDVSVEMTRERDED